MSHFNRLIFASILLVGCFSMGCEKRIEMETTSQAVSDPLSNADLVKGGALYDKWWGVAGLNAPTEVHPLWHKRPDKTTNSRTGSTTHRCKECHGWDYKGINGVYGTGSHRTGIGGVFGTALSAQEIFALLKSDPPTHPQGHGFGGLGLSDADIWNVTRFVVEGAIDLDSVIDSQGRFIGNAEDGKTLYDQEIGSNQDCASCHGSDGLTLPFDAGVDGASLDFDAYPGAIATENPWEFQHKVRFGQPGTSMPAVEQSITRTDLANIGAYVQTLPVSPRE